MVYELTESGCWSHNHMNPLYLQLEEPEHIPGDEENSDLHKRNEGIWKLFAE